MNKRFSLLLLGVTLFYPTLAQPKTDSLAPKSGLFYDGLIFSNQNFVQMKANGGIVSNFLHSDLIKNDFWTDDIISSQKDLLTDHNRLGGSLQSSLLFHNREKHFGKKGPSPFYGIRHDFILSATANREVLLTGLEGNSKHQLMAFDEINGLSNFQASSLVFGLEFNQEKNDFLHRVSVSFIGGHRWSEVASVGGEIRTDSSGEYIQGTGTDIQSYSVNQDVLAGKGFALNFTMAQKKENMMWRIDLENFGLVSWASTRHQTVSPDFIFQGFDVTNAIRTASEYSFIDSLNQSYVTEEQISEVRPLPFNLSIFGSKQINSNGRLSARLNYLYTLAYLPRIDLNYHQSTPNEILEWTVGASLGGFGSYALNLGADLHLGEQLGIRARVTGAETLISSSLPVYWYGSLGCIFTFSRSE